MLLTSSIEATLDSVANSRMIGRHLHCPEKDQVLSSLLEAQCQQNLGGQKHRLVIRKSVNRTKHTINVIPQFPK